MTARGMVHRNSMDRIVLSVLSYSVVGFFALFTLLPCLILLVSSFTSEKYILAHGYSLFPTEFSLTAYELVFLNPAKIFNAYGVTLFITFIGTPVSLLLSSMGAFVISRKDLKHRNKLSFFLYFTTLFNGGLASYYIIISKYYHLKNTLLILLLVPMFNVFYILILRNFIKGSVPESLIEAARIDGSNDLRIFFRIVLPLLKPALASIGLFIALGYWNDWWTTMMFVEKESLYPMQYVLYQIISSARMASTLVSAVANIDMPKESLKLALVVISIGPIVLLYPFLQRYFVKGITIGSVKG
jgi:putative aldouronate transport system permease protein